MKILLSWFHNLRKEYKEVKDMFVMLYVSRVMAGRMSFAKVPKPLKEAVKRELTEQLGEEGALVLTELVSEEKSEV